MNKKNNKPKKTAYEIKKDVAYFTKNRLPAFVLAGLIIFWTIASIFGIIGFSRSKPKNTAMISASADSFQGALRYEYSIDIVPLFGMINYDSSNYDVFDEMFTVNIDSGGAYLTYGDVSIADGNETSFSPQGLTGQAVQVTCGFYISHNEYVDDIVYEDITLEVYYYGFVTDDIPQFLIDITFFDGENSYTVECALYIEFNYDNVFVPFKSIGFHLTDQSVYLGLWSSHVPYDESWYYYSEYIKGIGDYNIGYKEGYLQGLKTPNQNSFDEGYAKGKTDGYRNGYDVGFTKGATDGNDYTFTGLLSAIFDVPVNTFTSLFNFDLLGVNLANFFLSMLTLAVVLTIVRMLL